MPSKLSRYAEGVLEAVWLAAVILVPVFFNVYSSRIFEPDKLAILRSLALVALGAWITKIASEGRVRWEQIPTGESRLAAFLKLPLVLPALSLALIYILATLFSVTARVSFWGSYQRLQGLYSTLSYMVIFATMLGTLRRRAQVERLITLFVVTSLPVALYGILQRYQIDPIPWGGDVSKRIAANMGNSIFVAAYLIMVAPLTYGRIIQSFTLIMRGTQRIGMQTIRATLYTFIAALQLVAIVYSGSRGPLLGFLVGLFLLLLMLSFYWHKRWLAILGFVVPLLAGGILYVMQIPNGPLAPVCKVPGIGRFCILLDPDSNSALVRQYIWEGTVALVAPHDPLQFPTQDGGLRSDTLNFLRPLVGYGPESMYVAYNPFYVPSLGQVEKRNASPDRSHNETWDSLVITGLLGLLAYLSVFLSIFYYGLKWLGLVNSPGRRNLFWGLCLAGGAIGAIGVIVWRGVEYLGVGLPFGILGGLVLYLVLMAALAFEDVTQVRRDPAQMLVLVVLLSAVAAHFAEINFGIAIAVTRTYFWMYAALLVLVGFILPKHKEYQEAGGAPVAASGPEAPAKSYPTNRSRTSKVVRGNEHTVSAASQWWREALLSAGIVTILLFTLGYDFVSNAGRFKDGGQILIASFSKIIRSGQMVTSYGILGVILTAWLVIIVILTLESERPLPLDQWISCAGAALVMSLVAALMYWVIQSVSLASLASENSTLKTVSAEQAVAIQVGSVGALLTTFYFFIFLVIIGLAFVLPDSWPVNTAGAPAGWVAAPVVLVVAVVLIGFTNLRIIQADMAFKMAEPYAKETTWKIAELIYHQAISMAPDEDHYYLFLGRSYLEQAKTVKDDPAEQQALVQQAEKDLKHAQSINPLNTDHTANLARLYSWWATRTTSESDAALRLQRAQTASDYYNMAVTLSPNNSNLWGEWALLFLDLLRQPQEAYERLSYAMGLDTKYSWTQGLMGTYYLRQAQNITQTASLTPTLQQALDHFIEAARVAKSTESTEKRTYLAQAGDLYTKLKQPDKALEMYLQALALKPTASDAWRFQAVIAQLYAQQGNKADALTYASKALETAPEAQRATVQALLQTIQAMP